MFLLIVTIYWLAFLLLALSTRARVRSLLASAAPGPCGASARFHPARHDLARYPVRCGVAARGRARLERARTGAAYPRSGPDPRALASPRFGILLRPNALFAIPVLATYILWPMAFRLKRAALAYIPLAVAFYALVPLVYYGALNAKKEHPLHSVFVFDLGGISHFTKENQFPVTFTPEQNATADRRLLPADALGHLLESRPLQIRDGEAGRRKDFRHARS